MSRKCNVKQENKKQEQIMEQYNYWNFEKIRNYSSRFMNFANIVAVQNDSD